MALDLQPRSEAEFEDTCIALTAGYDSPFPERAEWLEERVYELVSHLIEEDRLALFGPRHLLLIKRGPTPRFNPFSLALRVIFARRPTLQGAKARDLMGNRLFHAYRHFIPAPFIAMFLGPHGRVPPVQSDMSIAPGFERWVAYHLRWSEEDMQLRGQYLSATYKTADTIPRDTFPQLTYLSLSRRESDAAEDWSDWAEDDEWPEEDTDFQSSSKSLI